MGRVFRKTPQQTDGFRPERPQLGCEASNGRSGGPGIIWTLQKASKGCLAGETIQRMVYSPVSIGHLIGSVRWTTRKPSIGHFSECPIDGFHPGPAVEKKGSIVEKLFKRWSMVEKRSKNAARGHRPVSYKVDKDHLAGQEGILLVNEVLSHTQVSSCFPHCPPLLLPCTPLVTPPTPASQCTPLAALWIGLPPPLPPLVRSKPRFRLSVLPLLCSPSAAYTKPQSAVGREPRIPRSKLFGTYIWPASLFPALQKARLSTNAPPLSSALHAFRISREHSAYA
ncbi:hypothetical protein PGTUg99_020926 [Puccinia graminis f. sp. tritici]|uniref:Uncharacterized protein n=1 Tax=Puccinia graminis f. sp. tritici TaxID=56615 RepID=A0A5B0Q856_PUCGR|nr:hypothetical protein PGTUg99_020926 [Puccinia graminis f. sp. tritici]